MTSDRIIRPPEILRTAAPTGIPAVRRDKDREQPQDGPPDETADHDDPEDQVVISDDVPPGFADADNDDHTIMLDAIFDLLAAHRADYPLADYTLVQDQLAFLQSHAVTAITWPAHLTLQQAIAQACRTLPPTTDLTESP